MSDVFLEMRGISKSFSGVNVLKNVDLKLHAGEILALLGENGAGKTTLMNILGGVLKSDAGLIEIEGRECHIHSTLDAKNLGIAFIHQELNVVNDLKVFENLFLGSEVRKGIVLNEKAMIAKTRNILDRLNVSIDPCVKVSTLDASYKQIIEIAGVLLKNARIIIMDEPTTSLTNIEIEILFKTMRSLKHQGISMIFISHKL